MIRTGLIEVLELLEKDKKIYEIFKECPYQILRTIKLKTYPEGKFCLEQGYIHDNFYIIVEGDVDIFVESDHGKKYYLTTYGKGRFIGELELFEKSPYMSRVVAKGKLTVLEIERDQCIKWLELDHNFNQYVLKILCNVTYISMRKMGDDALYTLKQRICQFLIDNADEKGRIPKTMNVEFLSGRMGVTTRSVNRVLKELKDKNILEIEKSGVVIKDFEQLLKEKYEN